MAPLFRLILWLLTILPGIALSNGVLSKDSIDIATRDSIAYKLYLSRPDSSINIARQTLIDALNLKSKRLEGLSYYILSKSYWAKANYKLSAEFGFKALKIFEHTDNVSLWSKSLLALARTFIDLQNHTQGSNY